MVSNKTKQDWTGLTLPELSFYKVLVIEKRKITNKLQIMLEAINKMLISFFS